MRAISQYFRIQVNQYNFVHLLSTLTDFFPPGNEPQHLQNSSRTPPSYQHTNMSCGWPNVPTEIYFEIARYLSREDALNLRLVCRDFSIAMMGPVFGSVVVPFGRAMYDTSPTTCAAHPSSASMFEKYGLAIRKFGISFETGTGKLPFANLPCQATDGTRFASQGSDKDNLE